MIGIINNEMDFSKFLSLKTKSKTVNDRLGYIDQQITLSFLHFFKNIFNFELTVHEENENVLVLYL